MPLDGPHEAPVRHIRGLNNAIWCDGHGGPRRRKRLERLMMIAVDREWAIPQQRREGRGRDRRHGVDRHIIRRMLVVLYL